MVAWPPGGGADIPARLAAGPMQQSLGQTVVIENRAGASGSVAAGMVAQAAPDGYTVLADTAAISINHLLIPGLPYDAGDGAGAGQPGRAVAADAGGQGRPPRARPRRR